MSRLKAVFPDNWQYVLNFYRTFLLSAGTQAAPEGLLLALLEIGVRFGERLSQLKPNGFVEIGCGLAIPSLTLAKLGNRGGRAIDVDPKVTSLAEDLKDRLGCDLEIQCRDVFKNRPKVKRGEILVAEKPASCKKNILEVEYTVSNWCKIEGHNFAIIPSYIDGDTLASYSERCSEYERKLRQVGFKVENRQVYDRLPFRWLIVTK